MYASTGPSFRRSEKRLSPQRASEFLNRVFCRSKQDARVWSFRPWLPFDLGPDDKMLPAPVGSQRFTSIDWLNRRTQSYGFMDQKGTLIGATRFQWIQFLQSIKDATTPASRSRASMFYSPETAGSSAIGSNGHVFARSFNPPNRRETVRKPWQNQIGHGHCSDYLKSSDDMQGPRAGRRR